MRYTVLIDDNYHFADESKRRTEGEFDDRESAIAACKRIVDNSLAECATGKTADQMMAQYCMFGEDPWIKSDDADCKFSARDYARERCRELGAK
jgi:hypothetical protein